MTQEKLSSISNEDLLHFYKRSIELSGGKSPYDTEKLSVEILKRMNHEDLKVIHSPIQEVGDGHDEFS